MKVIKLFVLFLFLSTCVYSQALFKDKNGILSPKDARNVGVASLQNFSIGDTSIIRMRSGVVQFLGGGSWYAIPIPTSYVAYADSTVKYVTPNSFLSAFDTRLGTKTTTSLAEGINLYYTDARARASISETVPGLDYTSVIGVLSLTTGYVIPTTTQETNWNLAYTRSGLFAADTTNWNTAYSHTLLTNNPHLVTAAQVGLGNVTNESKATMFTNPTFTGTVTIPTPFTLGAVSVTTTPQQFNYLNGATGTTGTTTSNLVFSASPSLTGKTTVDSLLINSLTSGYLPYYGGTRLKNSEIYYNPVTGFTGIGTTSPGTKLEVAGGITETGIININRTTGDSQSISLNNSDGNDWYIDAYGGRLRFHEATPTNAERMTIIAGGNVGIGTNTILSKTGIAGNLAVGATYGALAAPTSGLIVEGRTLIGTSTDNTVDMLQVNGSLVTTQLKLSALNTAPATSSDSGILGEIRIANGYIYVCVAANTWQRVAITTW